MIRRVKVTSKEADIEIKPFGYKVRRFLLKNIFQLKEQRRVKKFPFGFGEPPDIPEEAEQVALAAYNTIYIGEDEKIHLIESYCKICKTRSIKLLSDKTRKLICSGCGKELAVL